MSDSEDSMPDRQAHSPAGRLGRRAGVLAFWLMCVFLIGMSARSIIPALYFPASAPQPETRDAVACKAELANLQDEMSDAAADSLREASIVEWRERQSAWEGRLHALAGGCGELERSRLDALQLQHELETMLEHYGQEAMRSQRRVRGALAAVPGDGPS